MNNAIRKPWWENMMVTAKHPQDVRTINASVKNNSIDNGVLIDKIDADNNLMCKNKIHVLIVDYNQLEYTQHVISNLLIQDNPFDITIFEQCANSKTIRYMNDLKSKWYLPECSINVVFNSVNAPLNHVWNWFYNNTSNEYLAILNNDIEICNNFISDAIKIFEKEQNCGIIIHPTNRPEYTKKAYLDYKIIESGFCQGWDFIVRRESYTIIPDDLLIWCGDSFIFSNISLKGYAQIIDISSPIIHYVSKTITDNANNIQEICKNDVITYASKYKKRLGKCIGGDNEYTCRSFNGLFPIDITKKIIVSFTSWEKRIGNVSRILDNMMKQTKQPDKIILNLSSEEFAGKNYLLTDVHRLEIENPIFEVNMVDGHNTKVWKKWLPIIDKYNNDLILPIDDDIVYPETFIESLYDSWKKHPFSPISGNKVVLGGYLQCHCGAGSLIARTNFGIYLDDYKNMIHKLCGSTDVFYSFCAYMNGYEYVESGMDTLIFERKNEIEPYSENLQKDFDTPIYMIDFEFLTKFYNR